VQHVARAVLQRHVDVVEDDRVGHGTGRRVRELEAGLHAATPRELLRHDAAVGERVGFHEQRRQVEPASATATAASALTTTRGRILTGAHAALHAEREAHHQRRRRSEVATDSFHSHVEHYSCSCARPKRGQLNDYRGEASLY
jgi:hypothetical protein